MAQKMRDGQLEKRSNRLKLPLRTRKYKILDTGVALSYRRTSEDYGTWAVRLVLADGRYTLETLGTADDYADANGQTILSFGQAQAKALKRHKELQQAGGVIKAATTVKEASEHYLEWFRTHSKSIAATETTIKAHILPTFGETPLEDLKAERIKSWHTRLATKAARKRTRKGAAIAHRAKPETDDEKRSRKSTANRILTVFKAMLNKAYEDALVSTNDAWKRVKPFSDVDEPVIRFLKPEEATRLINACPEDFRRLIKAALMTGARYSELAGMKVEDYSPDTKQVFIRPSKSGKGRHVPLTTEGAALFATCTDGKTGDALVFQRSDGAAWGKNYQVRPLLEACKVAKIAPSIGFHELRHTYASFLANAGADLLTISKLLGHADTRITSRHYAHLCDKTLRNAVDKFLPSLTAEPKTKVTPIKRKAA
ncbi:MAG: tyrosine-type recombinase/integrase [Burkholderiales bacterium]|jgi:integrase|nr:site-specific integrase [Rhodocyclaceae bacterium]MCA3018596.1 site-specific integrase [Rhodocyclaceae bacterium]MCA3022005.1 site-specific integrase [Rhodocyclaceae bacterium]MCA3024910.1 site-specific integrase [Rhodocyclaceae bacterium]MCA3032219.1 site-specific integrase [Rhodocyclaceae bacterium]